MSMFLDVSGPPSYRFCSSNLFLGRSPNGRGIDLRHFPYPEEDPENPHYANVVSAVDLGDEGCDFSPCLNCFMAYGASGGKFTSPMAHDDLH